MISVTILTKNSAPFLHSLLTQLVSFPEVIILDTGSEDDTLKIAAQFANVSIHTSPFVGFGKTHNIASDLAHHEWILSLDSDEIPTDELIEEIHSLDLDPNSVYSISRHNWYRNKWIKGCGWYPDRVVRLYNKKATRFSEDEVHETVLSKHLQIISLKNPVNHHPYNSIDDFLRKMSLYSSLFAKQHKGRKKASFVTALSHGCWAFFKSFFLKRGFLLGTEGLEISLYNSITAYYKYLKLRL